MPYALLTILQPGHGGRELKVTEDVVSIGRAPENTISLEDDTNVSRYHAEIEKRDDSFFVLDLGSSNGTKVNDIAVEFERRLHDGDTISIGNSTIIEFKLSDQSFRDSEPPQPSETPAAPEIDGLPASSSAVSNAEALAQDATPALPSASIPTSGGGAPVLLIVGGVAGGLILQQWLHF